MFSTYGEICVQYLSENPKGGKHLGDLGEDGGNLYVYRTETGCVGVVWTRADKWRALVNTVMNYLHLCVEPTQMHMLQRILMLHNLRFFSSKCHLFHNATLFGSCIIHILDTRCAKN
jgi:hypothetical protein